MGRTNPTFRDVLRSIRGDWEAYRRALRVRDHDAYDQLWEDAHQYADAAGYLNHPRPMVVVLFSIALAQQRRIDALETTLQKEEGANDGSDERQDAVQD